MTQAASLSALPSAGFFRRLGAYIYDAVMATAIAMVVTMLSLAMVAVSSSLGLLTLPEGVEPSSYLVTQIWFQGLIWGSIILFYIWFWHNQGQTIGMRAWRLRVQNKDGSNISYTQALIRLFTSALGLGNVMVLLTKDKTAFQDIWGKCQVVTLPKK
ncbi:MULTISPECIES: RDD family protein [unclassified Agarivorans]|uniref:RDD family protein n=1 Tax=unclassified Agarivorans TaxID=2636026 RepID=UPI003D7D09B9